MSLNPRAKLTEFIFRNPERTLWVLIICCLLVFLVTIPLPRVDNQLIGSDGIKYYVYLPSLLLDGDLDFSDEYAYFFSHEPAKAEQLINNPTPQGVPPNQWPMGPAILWAPFFLLAHTLAHLLNLIGASIPTAGYGYFYQVFVISGSILYGGAGLLLTYRFARDLAAERAALIATVLVTFAGNLVYYMTAEPSMSHTLSVFASGLFFYIWMRRQERPGVKTSLLCGLAGGLMALIRPQDGLFLALPFLAQLPDVWRNLRSEENPKAWRRWLQHGLLAGLVALVIFSPQMWAWGQIYGDYFRSPYTYQEQPVLFDWFSPALGAVLFSAFRGLFTWHPVFLLALLGLVLTYRKNRTFATLGFIGFVMQWYLISSWHSWEQGDAFGGRMFIVCTPIFVLGLASLIEWGAHRWSWVAVYVIGGLLLAWNFLLFVQYRFEIVTAQRAPTWYDLTAGRVTFIIDLVGRLLE